MPECSRIRHRILQLLEVAIDLSTCADTPLGWAGPFPAPHNAQQYSQYARTQQPPQQAPCAATVPGMYQFCSQPSPFMGNPDPPPFMGSMQQPACRSCDIEKRRHAKVRRSVRPGDASTLNSSSSSAQEQDVPVAHANAASSSSPQESTHAAPVASTPASSAQAQNQAAHSVSTPNSSSAQDQDPAAAGTSTPNASAQEVDCTAPSTSTHSGSSAQKRGQAAAEATMPSSLQAQHSAGAHASTAAEETQDAGLAHSARVSRKLGPIAGNCSRFDVQEAEVLGIEGLTHIEASALAAAVRGLASASAAAREAAVRKLQGITATARKPAAVADALVEVGAVEVSCLFIFAVSSFHLPQWVSRL